VPTPFDPVRRQCDLTAVEDALRGSGNGPVCIKSTVPPGTIERLRARFERPIAYSPEWMGESPGHPWPDSGDCGFVVVAGDDTTCDLIRSAYAIHDRVSLTFYRADSAAVELAKYMENCFLATKVALANQFYDLALAAGTDYEQVRAICGLDARIGASHTNVTAERGFGGKCLPKDLDTLVAWAREHAESGALLLESVRAYNAALRRERAI